VPETMLAPRPPAVPSRWRQFARLLLWALIIAPAATMLTGAIIAEMAMGDWMFGVAFGTIVGFPFGIVTAYPLRRVPMMERIAVIGAAALGMGVFINAVFYESGFILFAPTLAAGAATVLLWAKYDTRAHERKA
jgi:hypothetical protein